MSTTDILSTISLISFVLAGISAVLAVIFWFRFNIPAVIGDLSGRTARKSIEKMRANNEKTGKKDFAPSKTNLDRGKLTELMKESGKLSGKLSNKKNEVPITKKAPTAPKASVASKVAEDQMETALLEEEIQTTYETEETSLLTESEETALLNDDVMETELLDGTEWLEETEETGLLVEEENETMLLTEEPQQETKNTGVFTMIDEIMFVHTEETID